MGEKCNLFLFDDWKNLSVQCLYDFLITRLNKAEDSKAIEALDALVDKLMEGEKL